MKPPFPIDWKKRLREVLEKILERENLPLKITEESPFWIPSPRHKFQYVLPKQMVTTPLGRLLFVSPHINGRQIDQEIACQRVLYNICVGDFRVIAQIYRKPKKTIRFFLKPYEPEEIIVYNALLDLSQEICPTIRIEYEYHKNNKEDF